MDSIPMTPDRWERTQRWIEDRFAPDAAWYRDVMRRAVEAGLPSIDAGAATASLLGLLATSLHAKLIVEVGTLAGATSALLARGLSPGGRVITIESEPKHAAFARSVLHDAGVADQVEVREGTGLTTLDALLAELGEGAVDLIFLDAQRSEYIPMLPIVRRLLRPGGILAIDNALSAGRWLPDPPEPGKEPDVMDAVCEAVRRDSAFGAMVMPIGNGVLLAVRIAPAGSSAGGRSR